MKPEEDDEALISTAMRLIGQLQRGKASKKTALMLAVSICLDVALSIIVVFLTIGQIHGNSGEAVVQYSQCVENNSARAQDKLLWGAFFSDATPKGAKLTPKIIAEVTELRAIVNAKDAPRDCKALYPH